MTPRAESACRLVCCRGVLFENTGRFEEALADYKCEIITSTLNPSSC